MNKHILIRATEKPKGICYLHVREDKITLCFNITWVRVKTVKANILIIFCRNKSIS